MQRLIRLLLSIGATLAVTLVIGCGAGGGTQTFLPAGDPTTAAPGDQVLYVSLSHDNRVVGYRLGADGLMPRAPFTSIDLDNPRSITLGDDGILYVLLEDRVVALTLAADGSLPELPTSQTDPLLTGSEGTDLLLVDGAIYAAFRGIGRILTFVLESGQVPPLPVSSSGGISSDYRALAASNGFVYGAARGSSAVDTYAIQPDGSLLTDPEPQTPTALLVRPSDLLVNDGVLYGISQSRERIDAFHIRPNGLLPEEADSFTLATERYARMVLDGNHLYASGFSHGWVDVYTINPDGSLPKVRPFARTASDAATLPIALVLDNGILYVGQSGIGRIDAYILNADGSPAEFPSSSTDPIEGSTPLDLALGVFPR